MHSSFRWVAALAMVAASAAAGAAPCTSLSSARWLLGEWVAEDGDKVFVETWKQLSSETFEGSGVTTSKASARPVDGESLRLVQMADRVFYVSKVAHNRLPIAFELLECSAQRLVFENASHDFPKKLEYETRGADGMTVRVSDGKDKGFTLVFRRRSGS